MTRQFAPSDNRSGHVPRAIALIAAALTLAIAASGGLPAAASADAPPAPGTEWTLQSNPDDNNWVSVAYGRNPSACCNATIKKGIFVAVSNTGFYNRVMTSPDGVNWTTRATPSQHSWYSVTYGVGQGGGSGAFVAVAQDGYVMTSPDGITWTDRPDSPHTAGTMVTWGTPTGTWGEGTSTWNAGRYVSVGRYGKIETSDNGGVTWTSRTVSGLPLNVGWTGVTWGNGQYVAVGNCGDCSQSDMLVVKKLIATSPDGINWTVREAPAAKYWYDVKYGNGKFVAIASNDITESAVMTSTDGVTWTLQSPSYDAKWIALAFGAGTFVAITNLGATGTDQVMTSTDGVTWTTQATPLFRMWRQLTYGNGLFVAVAFTGTGNRVMTSGALLPDPPTVTRTSPTSSPTKSDSATITYSGAAGTTLWCSLDGAAYAVCDASPASITGLADGTHTYSVKAVDANGGESDPTTVSWVVDTAPPAAPTVRLTSPTSSPTTQRTATITYSGDAGSTFTCSRDGGAYGACPASPVSLTSLSEGDHSYSVKATDSAGNVSDAGTVTWTVDLTAPAAPGVVLTSPTSSPTSDRTATITYSGEANATFTCSLDNATYTACPASPVSLTNLGNGSHTYRVKQTDAAGNVSTAGSVTWVVDITPPAVPSVWLASPTSSPTNQTTASVTYSGEAGATLTCSLDGGAYSPCTGSPVSLTGLAEGTHTYSVKAADALGNTSNAGSVSWVVDLTPPAGKPTVTLTSPTSSPANQDTATITYSGPAGADYHLCSLDGAAYQQCTGSPVSLNNLSNGDHTYSVKASDYSGNETEASSVSWTVNYSKPTITLLQQPTNPSGTDVTIKFTLSPALAPGQTVMCLRPPTSPGPPTTIPCSPDTAFDLKGLATGPQSLTIMVMGPGPLPDPVNLNWFVSSTPLPPAINLTQKPSDPSGSDVTFAFTVTPALSGTQRTACYLDPGPSGSTEVPCTPGTPFDIKGLADGPHSVYVVVFPSSSPGPPSGQTSYNWTVAGGGAATKPAAPTLISKPSSPSKDASGQITFSGEAGVTFECQLDGGAWSACSSPFSYSGLADGSHTFKTRASKGGLTSDETTHVWTVDTTPPAAPTITSKPPATTTDVTASIGFTGSGDPDATFECRVDGGTAAACSGNPVQLSGLTVGAHDFEVREVDAAGNRSPAASTSWTVQPSPGPCTPRAVPPTPTKTVKLTRIRGGIWVMNAGSVFNTGGDTRGCAQILTIQVSVDPVRPLDSLPHPTVISFQNGILAWTGKDVSRNGKQPRWMRVGNRIGRWTGWVEIKY